MHKVILIISFISPIGILARILSKTYSVDVSGVTDRGHPVGSHGATESNRTDYPTVETKREMIRHIELYHGKKKQISNCEPVITASPAGPHADLPEELA